MKITLHAYKKSLRLCQTHPQRIHPRGTPKMNLRTTTLALTLALSACVAASPTSANPTKLRTAYRENPLGLDVAVPELSWQSDNTERNWRQSAYEILVATRADLLAPGKAEVWDSTKKMSAESVAIAYGGPALHAKTRYFWTVRVWDASGKASAWAAPAYFETG